MPTTDQSATRRGSLDLSSLAAEYAGGRAARDVLAEVLDRIDAYDDAAVWIERFSRQQVFEQVEKIEQRRRQGAVLPLYGIPFAVKDNIDVGAHPTTAACPAFSYVASKSAPCVTRLCDAGAILVGKTNLDQFATGLVGVRSPYGTPRNPFDPRYIPGGSSSGSAVVVAAGLVSFALGTDTAGSGRVPAGFNNIVGLKPTRGLISTSGVVPACGSLDCVSVFALTCDDATDVVRAASGFDPIDAASRDPKEFERIPLIDAAHFTFGVPADSLLRFFGNDAAAKLYRAGIERLESIGGTRVEIDFAPFLEAGQLLYQGPWVVERLEAAGKLLANGSEAILPVTRRIFEGAAHFTASDVFAAGRQLAILRRRAMREWLKVDLLALPTSGTIYTLAQIESDPITLNTNLGYYTHFANLLDLCGASVPSGFLPGGLPMGLMLMAQAGQDQAIMSIGARFQQSTGLKLGATQALPPVARLQPASRNVFELAVVGAHLSGQPLNHQLTSRNARLARTCRTTCGYKLFALPGTVPPKPGLLRLKDGMGGTAIEVEVWELTAENFGSFVASVPPPMGIGTIELEDGGSVKGFICEPYAITGARDISHYGGWRSYLQALSQPAPSPV
jgi:allophanate hydrolase